MVITNIRQCECGSKRTQVYDVRQTMEGDVKRRRQCMTCGKRWTTIESMAISRSYIRSLLLHIRDLRAKLRPLEEASSRLDQISEELVNVLRDGRAQNRGPGHVHKYATLDEVSGGQPTAREVPARLPRAFGQNDGAGPLAPKPPQTEAVLSDDQADRLHRQASR